MWESATQPIRLEREEEEEREGETEGKIWD